MKCKEDWLFHKATVLSVLVRNGRAEAIMWSAAHGTLVLNYGVRTYSPTCMPLSNLDIWQQRLLAINMTKE